MSRFTAIQRWCAVGGLFCFATTMGVGLWLQRARAADVVQPQSNSFMALNKKFEGAKTCAGSNCHSATQEEPAPARMANQLAIWTERDKHFKSYQTLANDTSKAIAQKMNIADAAVSERCLGCHTINAPEALRGKEFDLNEGVTCNGCHGPSAEWNKPHIEIGWTAKARQQFGGNAQQLLQNTGLYDTKDIAARADMCTSCHLAIDAEMVNAGHPQPRFELSAYSASLPPHWRDVERYVGVKAWASGQVACTRDAMKQLAARAASANATDASVTDAYNQAMAHYTMLLTLAQTMGLDATALTNAAKPLAQGMPANKQELAEAASAVAEQAHTLTAQVRQVAPNKDMVLRLMRAVAANTVVDKYGAPDAGAAAAMGIAFGQSQHGLALSSLFRTYAEMENLPQETVERVFQPIGQMFHEDGKSPVDPALFEAGRKAAQAQLDALQ